MPFSYTYRIRDGCSPSKLGPQVVLDESQATMVRRPCAVLDPGGVTVSNSNALIHRSWNQVSAQLPNYPGGATISVAAQDTHGAGSSVSICVYIDNELRRRQLQATGGVVATRRLQTSNGIAILDEALRVYSNDIMTAFQNGRDATFTQLVSAVAVALESEVDFAGNVSSVQVLKKNMIDLLVAVVDRDPLVGAMACSYNPLG